MAKHEYTARQALEEILKRVQDKAPELAAEIQRNINLGQEVEEESSPRPRSGETDHDGKVVFSFEQAIQVTLDTLQAHFVEQPLFIASAHENFTGAAEGASVLQRGLPSDTTETTMHGTEMLKVSGRGEPKTLAFEIEPETRLVGTGEQILLVKPVTAEQIAERRKILDTLRELTDFTG